MGWAARRTRTSAKPVAHLLARLRYVLGLIVCFNAHVLIMRWGRLSGFYNQEILLHHIRIIFHNNGCLLEEVVLALRPISLFYSKRSESMLTWVLFCVLQGSVLGLVVYSNTQPLQFGVWILSWVVYLSRSKLSVVQRSFSVRDRESHCRIRCYDTSNLPKRLKSLHRTEYTDASSQVDWWGLSIRLSHDLVVETYLTNIVFVYLFIETRILKALLTFWGISYRLWLFSTLFIENQHKEISVMVLGASGYTNESTRSCIGL